MKNRSCLIFISALLLMLGGCAAVTTPSPVKVGAPDTMPQNIISGQPGESAIVEQVPKAVVSDNPAVIALLDRARLDNSAGQREAAGASLERALRIERRNAWLWHELAQLRLAQGQYEQAISIAQKSNSFSGRERRLQALNWRVIGNARIAQGNPSGAEQAHKLATELEQ